MRTLFTTILGVLAILVAAPASLFSAFALLMAVGKPYANASANLADILLLFVLPPVTLLAGVCLLLRQRWARWWMILLMAGLLAAGLKEILAPAPVGEFSTPIAPVFPVLCAVAGVLLLCGLFAPRVRREFQPRTRAAHAPAPSPPPMPLSNAEPAAAANGEHSLIRRLALPVVTAAICLWMAWDGLEEGQIRKSSRFSAERRVATRADDPVYYWTMLGLFTAVGGGCAAYTAWTAWTLAARLRRRG